MSNRLIQHSRQLHRLYQERGFVQSLLHLARAVLAALYSRQVQYIVLRRLDRPEVTPVHRAAEEGETECVVVDSPAALVALAPEFPASFRDSVDALTHRVAQGCVIVLARRPKKEGVGMEVVGYNLSGSAIQVMLVEDPCYSWSQSKCKEGRLKRALWFRETHVPSVDRGGIKRMATFIQGNKTIAVNSVVGPLSFIQTML